MFIHRSGSGLLKWSVDVLVGYFISLQSYHTSSRSSVGALGDTFSGQSCPEN